MIGTREEQQQVHRCLLVIQLLDELFHKQNYNNSDGDNKRDDNNRTNDERDAQ
jgi:hypothetical protein